MNPRFYVAYDLVYASSEQYAKLCAELRRIGASEVLKSDWILRWGGSVTQLRDHLVKFIHRHDRLVIVQIATWASWDAMVDINRV